MARAGFRKAYPTILDAFVGGEAAAFAALTSRGVPVPVVLTSPTINFMNVATTDFVMPLIAGKRFYASVVRVIFDTRDAALTGTFTGDLWQGGASILNAAVALTVANVNATPMPANYVMSLIGIKAFDMTTQVLQYRQAVAATGSGLTTCTGRVKVWGEIA